MAEVLYPTGYGEFSRMVTIDQLFATHGPKMHPTFRDNLRAYFIHKKGRLGIGGGWRSFQPSAEGFAKPGESFHQYQDFASGIRAYCAVDLVVPGAPNQSPSWADAADAPEFELHTFITDEPWHIQPINIRGWSAWVKAGRPDPKKRKTAVMFNYFKLAGDNYTLYQEIVPGVGVRVDPAVLDERGGVGTNPIRNLTQAEFNRYQILSGLPGVSAR